MSIETKPNQVAIDFASYRTPEIAGTIGELVSFVGLFRSLVVVPLLVGVVCLGVVSWLMVTAGNTTQMLTVPPIIISGSILLAFVGAIAETIRRSLGNMVKLVDLLLEATSRIAADMALVSSGESSMPSAAQLTRQVYTHVFDPLVESYLLGSFGFLGRPLSWAWRRSFGNHVRYAISLIPDNEASDVIDKPLDPVGHIGQAMESIARNQGGITRRLQWTRDKLAFVTGRIGFMMLVPYLTIAILTIAITVGASIWMWQLTAG